MWYSDMILGTRPLNNTFLSTVPPLLSDRECYAFFPGSCSVLRVAFFVCLFFCLMSFQVHLQNSTSWRFQHNGDGEKFAYLIISKFIMLRKPAKEDLQHQKSDVSTSPSCCKTIFS